MRNNEAMETALLLLSHDGAITGKRFASVERVIVSPAPILASLPPEEKAEEVGGVECLIVT